MSDPDELRSIAKQLRELATERDCRWILEMGGRLVTDAVDRGAFSGIEYLQLRHLLDTSRYKGPRSPHPRVFTAVVTWLIKHIDDLPLRSRQTFFEGPCMRGGAFVAEYVQTNIPAVAELIEGEALRLDGDVTPEEPVDESRRGRQPAEAPGETWITGCDGRAKRKRAGGRPPLSDREARKREELVEQWKQASAEGVCQKDFCADEGIPSKHLTKCINWLAQRRRRSNKP